ncbi:hypothetical protein MIND_00411600 [Mycena indigotica]|uniref:F-box domain-containing protein n=1 Tax=Mycena indigotica TaxID=2126181 RepID=A0A8H6W7V5_9AGAR|nr:uncharacterized protein MIND_00411600 [Mycena indigotica]KAF7306211.1 hypothetical protein MIND_00411600 [Mycena indigotica]
MHHCLELPEIVFKIASHAAEGDNYRGGLARLARTCHLFSEAACDQLWCSVHEGILLQLMRCLFGGHVSAGSDFGRAQRCLSRIRHLHLSFSTPRAVDMLLLATWLGGPASFPRLEKLDWQDVDQAEVSELLGSVLSSSPRLRTLHLKVASEAALRHITPIIAQIPLRRLTLKAPEDTDSDAEVVSSLIRSVPPHDLQSLEVDGLLEYTFRWLTTPFAG